jgi:ABC-type dipeptide/oligopeptide/nickel transport system permease subunit
MKAARIIACAVGALLALAGFSSSLSTRLNYSQQDRTHLSSPPSSAHWLGTDMLGRDRLARLVHGTAVSLSLSPAAAALSVLLAFGMGGCAGLAGGVTERVAKVVINLMLSIPWLFLLLIVRAAMPLNMSPAASATITFLMLGLFAWGAPARILLARAGRLRQSEFLLLARSAGVSPARLVSVHLMPNLLPVMEAQFWIAVPVFILAEANLSLLGLGVAEPLPSLGNLLSELESVLSLRTDLCSFSALLVLVLIVGSLQVAFIRREVS